MAISLYTYHPVERVIGEVITLVVVVRMTISVYTLFHVARCARVRWTFVFFRTSLFYGWTIGRLYSSQDDVLMSRMSRGL